MNEAVVGDHTFEKRFGVHPQKFVTSIAHEFHRPFAIGPSAVGHALEISEEGSLPTLGFSKLLRSLNDPSFEVFVELSDFSLCMPPFGDIAERNDDTEDHSS